MAEAFGQVPPALLAAFNAAWGARAAAFRDHTAPPWWRPGQRVTPALRQAYQAYLPITGYLDDLRWLLAPLLPSRTWLPRTLADHDYPALPDLWRDLPLPLAGRVTWQAAELLPLACALASPRHFGTRAGRYPEQRALLADHAARLPAAPLVVDAGCGTGQGLYELLGWLVGLGRAPRAIGITREPLEAWMAAHRRLPHLDPLPAEYAFPPRPIGLPCLLVAGDIARLPLAGGVDLLVCNGLLGGPACPPTPALAPLLACWAAALRPGGLLLLGHRFHPGHDTAPLAALLRPAFRLLAATAASQLLVAAAPP